MSDYIDYSEPLLKVKAMVRVMDNLLLANKFEDAISLTPEIIVELRMMQSLLLLKANS
jgi:hypothetical protein